MIRSLICLVLVGSVISSSLKFTANKVDENKDSKHWAIIVAGSNGWYNYRHQADACHAFQIMKSHGIPEKQIVVMMYDDIAHNKYNPTPGIIINRPNGTDVYGGVPKDYTKDDVTPENFLKILQGKSMEGVGSGKVIASGPNDRVFVNFVDHGAPGIVAFPEGELHARDLVNSIKKMHKNKKFAEMVLYFEACESGSMFKTLPVNIDTYATTASNGQESSYACYYDKKRQTYLGDVYSVKWMEDSDRENLNTETLHGQFEIVKKEVNTSHVQQFGDQTISKEPVADFQGNKKAEAVEYHKVPLDAVPAPDVPLAILWHRLADAESHEERQAIGKEIMEIKEKQKEIKEKVREIATIVTEEHEITKKMFNSVQDINDHDCYEKVAKQFSKQCYSLSKEEFALRQMYVFVNMCEAGYEAQNIIKAFDYVC